MVRTALALTALAVLAAAGCASDPKDTGIPKVSIATATTGTGSLKVELLSDGPLETGVVPLYVKVSTADGQAVTDAGVSFEPMMAMTPSGMQHRTPVGQPVLQPDGLYHGYVSFVMAGGMMGSWSAVVGVTRPGQARVDASFPMLSVTESDRETAFDFVDPDTLVTTRYYWSYRYPSGMKVGLSPVQFTLHTKASMMSWPSVDDAVIHVDPEMPSMGHGGSGTVDPVLATSGLYQGTVGYTMHGPWVTTVTVRRGTNVIHTFAYDQEL